MAWNYNNPYINNSNLYGQQNSYPYSQQQQMPQRYSITRVNGENWLFTVRDHLEQEYEGERKIGFKSSLGMEGLNLHRVENWRILNRI